ncbi:aldehyde dehydrogenase family protein [Pseudoteredinibacter isoporae]|uniref:Acyl-CoA reductase-like NAD-dependent aldehyde dehydrogenase n=1 Tax=Pseudoteredinibacter isoporae TaxID=570281 RepID=A0A7X0JUQ3_9GAMM|nr:aldehyde dehydrogenase family protein [Pseudoteredinibacter isoporae]MBB6522609.1 acyl-CoA reductase-like NAD-dependent aldehyde dehydrogenase [Pseudoteredinibacter isoporae]NHO88139.1 aldehyde dehydrogenase family protein [Pseudoteredinibacter isoporae]NIB23530.1 aldehyde dehydrogenase family protein [Pseudoteredinibacter isoporae]
MSTALHTLSEQTEERLTQPQSSWIAGRFIGGSDVHAIVNPSTAEAIAEYCAAQQADVEAAVSAARESFDQERWTGLSPSDRGRALWRLADLMEEQAELLAEMEMLNAGKSLAAARNGEIPFAADCFRYFAGWCSKLDGASKKLAGMPSGEFMAYTHREPVGVAALIVPWNGPLVQACWKLAPALAAGCSCVLKPAEETPLTVLLLAELAKRAGIPDGVLNVVLGGADIGAQLVEHPQVDKVSFTGSTTVGKRIVSAAQGNLKKVSLELGGKSPMIVFPDADVDAAAAGVIDGIFSNAGQVCVASSRLYVHRDIYSTLLEKLKALAIAIEPGDARDPNAGMGPLISQRHRESVMTHIERAQSQGASLLCGGKRLNREGYFIEPTIFTDLNNDMDLIKDEVFGPVLAVQVFDDEDDIVAMANDSDYGLAASIWTQDISRAHKTAAKIKAGLLWINCHGLPDMAVPFGGYKQSGWGRENGEEAIAQYTETKSVIVRL